jgi:hypothetical protein
VAGKLRYKVLVDPKNIDAEVFAELYELRRCSVPRRLGSDGKPRAAGIKTVGPFLVANFTFNIVS